MVEAEECVQKQSVSYEAVWYTLTVYPGAQNGNAG